MSDELEHPAGSHGHPGALVELDGNHRALRAAQAREVELLARACDEYRVHESDADAGAERLLEGGSDGTPLVGEFLALEIAGILGCPAPTAALKLAAALNLRHRHPELWRAVLELRVEPWHAQDVVDLCLSAGLTAEASRWVDSQLSRVLALLPWAPARRLVRGLIVRADPGLAAARAETARGRRGVHIGLLQDGAAEMVARLDAADALHLDGVVSRLAGLLASEGDAAELQARRARALTLLATPHVAAALLEGHATDGSGRVDHDKLRPKATLVVHVSADDLASATGVARVEAVGPLDLGTLRHFLGHSCVTVRPLVDLNDTPPVDRYEVPPRMREAIITRHSVEGFPWSSRPARGCEMDHTVPFDHRAGPGSGQTRPGNLGPLGKRAHRARTHGGWRLVQPHPGVFWWRSPAGFGYLVTPSGTTALGPTTLGTPALGAADPAG